MKIILCLILLVLFVGCSKKIEYYSDGSIKHSQGKLFGVIINEEWYLIEGKK